MENRYQNVVNQMVQRLQLGSIIIQPNNKIANAHATHDKHGQKLIEYNPLFMNNLESHSQWAVLMVIAHEVAHHYNEDLYGRFYGGHNTSQRQELNADRFAGYMLRCIGARWDQATAAYKLIDFRRTTSHPDKFPRIEAFRAGWNEAACNVNPPRRIVKPYNNDTNKTLLSVAAGAALLIAIFAALSGE